MEELLVSANWIVYRTATGQPDPFRGPFAPPGPIPPPGPPPPVPPVAPAFAFNPDRGGGIRFPVYTSPPPAIVAGFDVGRIVFPMQS